MIASKTSLQAEHLDLYRSDRIAYCSDNLWIRTKDAQLIQLRPNQAQRLVEARVERQKRETGRVRVVVLKARQEGISTWVAARIYHGCTLWPRRRGLVLADDLDRAAEIFSIYERYEDHSVAPPRKISRRARELAWVTDSRLTVETARDRNAGRAGTVDYVHGSEFALWPYPEDTLTALLDAMPSDAGEFWIESTAQGVGNSFHEMWEAAVEGTSEWLAIFLPWWIDPGYRLEVTEADRVEILGHLDAFEASALTDGIEWDRPDDIIPPLLSSGARFNETTGGWVLTVEQLAWRRRKIREKKGDERAFRQENPATAEEAFLVSGSPFFDEQALSAARKDVAEPRERANLLAAEGAVVLQPSDRGWLLIFQGPAPNGHYVIGADTAEGRVAGTDASLSDPEAERGGSDFCSADVLLVGEDVYDPKTKKWSFEPRCEQVAHLHGRIAPEVFASQLCGLGMYYSCRSNPTEKGLRDPALQGVERNHSSGQTVLRRLRELRYPNLYWHRRLNVRTDRPTAEVGWITDQNTRQPMLDGLAEALRTGDIRIPCAATLREMATFVWVNRGSSQAGRPEAQEGCHDDRVISLAIAREMGRRHHHASHEELPPEPVADTPTGI